MVTLADKELHYRENDFFFLNKETSAFLFSAQVLFFDELWSLECYAEIIYCG